MKYEHPSQYEDVGPSVNVFETISSDDGDWEEPETATKPVTRTYRLGDIPEEPKTETVTKPVTKTLGSATRAVTDSLDDEESKKRQIEDAPEDNNEKKAKVLRDVLEDLQCVKEFKKQCTSPDPSPKEERDTGHTGLVAARAKGLVQTWEDVGKQIDDIIHLPCCETADGYNTRRDICTIQVTNYTREMMLKLWGDKSYKVIA